MPATPTRWKKRLGKFLRELREHAEKQIVECAELLHTTPPTVSRYESGHLRPQWPALQQLLIFYGATEAQRDEGATLWNEAGTQTTRVRLPADAPKDLRKLVRAELEAKSVRLLEPSAVPGLLQTEAYMRAVMTAGHRFLDLAAVDTYVTARLNRQKRLSGPNPVHVHALLDEAAIHRVVGGSELLLEQLGYLLAIGTRPNIAIQVIPYGAGAYGAMSGPCTIINYSDPQDQPGVYLEYLAGGRWVEDSGDIERITTMFDDVIAVALTPSDSADVIRQQMRALEDQWSATPSGARVPIPEPTTTA
jgi:transcriptional regulator with XRE-family HTH domain